MCGLRRRNYAPVRGAKPCGIRTARGDNAVRRVRGEGLAAAVSWVEVPP